jgi:hypothetical protein
LPGISRIRALPHHARLPIIAGVLRLFQVVSMAALLASGCTFDATVSAGQGGDAGNDTVAPDKDALPIVPDADPNAPDAAFCASFVSAHFDACSIGSPSAGLDLTMSGTYTYNTDAGTLEDPLGTPIVHQSVMADLNGVNTRIVSVDALTLAAVATLRGEGSLPLVIAAWGDVEIAGTINFDSRRGQPPAAGANPAACENSGAAQGDSNSSGGGGGGGGGFGGKGGNGGNGNNNNNESSGGAGGVGLLQPPAEVRGGCASASGGSALLAAAEASAGGGAIQLTSKTMLSISGSIFAGGAGGFGGPQDSRAGGSGGGSGGFIGLQAPIIEIDDAALIVANGGGGGEGTSSARTGVSGQDSRHTLAQASGGDGNTEFGTGGGKGGADTTLAGESVTDSLVSGAGGGGGSVGFVLLWSPSFAGTGAVVSPPLTSL